MTERGRVLGLDLGDARIGVAISDDDRRLAVPIGTAKLIPMKNPSFVGSAMATTLARSAMSAHASRWWRLTMPAPIRPMRSRLFMGLMT